MDVIKRYMVWDAALGAHRDMTTDELAAYRVRQAAYRAKAKAKARKCPDCGAVLFYDRGVNHWVHTTKCAAR